MLTKQDLKEIGKVVDERLDTKLGNVEKRLDEKLDTKLSNVEKRFDEKLDTKLNNIEQRFDEKLDTKINGLEKRFDQFEKQLDKKLDDRFDEFDKKVDWKLDERFRQFTKQTISFIEEFDLRSEIRTLNMGNQILNSMEKMEKRLERKIKYWADMVSKRVDTNEREFIDEKVYTAQRFDTVDEKLAGFQLRDK